MTHPSHFDSLGAQSSQDCTGAQSQELSKQNIASYFYRSEKARLAKRMSLSSQDGTSDTTQLIQGVFVCVFESEMLHSSER